MPVIRRTFLLNTDNPIENAINDFLETQYKFSPVIKQIIYNYLVENGLVNDNKVTTTLQESCNKVITNLNKKENNYNKVTTKLQENCNEVIIENDEIKITDKEGKDTFKVDFSKLDDTEIKVKEIDKEEENKNLNNTALNAMLGMGE